MLFSVFANDWNLKDRLAPIGWRHELPMVNVLDAVSPQFRVGVGERSVITRRQYFYDVFHPSNSGHRIMRGLPHVYAWTGWTSSRKGLPRKSSPLTTVSTLLRRSCWTAV